MPIPARWYAANKTYFACSASLPPPAQKLKAGEWTLFLFHEKTMEWSEYGAATRVSALRYAFVTICEDGDMCVVDAREFFQQALHRPAEENLEHEVDRLAEAWDQSMEGLRAAMTSAFKKVKADLTPSIRMAGSAEVLDA